MITLLLAPLAEGAEAPVTRNVVPSWGDCLCAYGPGTDPAMDTPQALENMIRHWRGRGYTGLYLRTDLGDLDPATFRLNPVVQPNPRLAWYWDWTDRVSGSFAIQRAAQEACDRHGMAFWAWHPHLFSDGAPEDVGTDGLGRMVPWRYVSGYTYEHPEVISVDRAGNRLWMCREYAYPGARAAKVAEFVYIARRFGVRGFLACLRSEVSQLQDPPDHGDQYGFNPPVAEEMKRRHDVDIITDSRFDWKSPGFDPRDPMVENWRNLRGEYLTQFFRELRQALREVDPRIKLAVTLSGEYAGPPLGNFRLDWRTWITEGLVDEIITPVFYEATLDNDAGKKGYLTHVREGKGTVDYATLRRFIATSPHPEAKIIASGAYPYFAFVPPVGADGWRCDVWYDLYHMAWWQRWQQWRRDLAEFGHIRFLEQGFDRVEFPAGSDLEAWGEPAYSPKLRACEGNWHRLGRGQDARPCVQAEVRRGDGGQAVRLTPTADGRGTLTGWHNSSPDRGWYTTAVDNAIANGHARLELWAYRATPGSALTVYLQGREGGQDIALRIAGGSGKVAYSDRGQWVETAAAFPVGTWERLSLEVDLDRKVYSADLGVETPAALCRDIPLVLPEDRFVEIPGVHEPLRVPAYKLVQQLSFVPDGGPTDFSYVDDISLKWHPTLHYTTPGSEMLLTDDFERTRPEGVGRGFALETFTSFGEGVGCLRADGTGDLTRPLRAAMRPDGRLTLDFDLLLRSSANFPYIIPDPSTRSDHETALGLFAEDGEPLAAARVTAGQWLYWDGRRWTETTARLAYDVWNHVQLTVDPAARTCRLVVQPVGELPTLAAEGAWRRPARRAQGVVFAIRPSRTPGHVSCYDNIHVAQDAP